MQDAGDGQYQCVGLESTGAASGVGTESVGESWAKAFSAGLGCYELGGYVINTHRRCIPSGSVIVSHAPLMSQSTLNDRSASHSSAT